MTKHDGCGPYVACASHREPPLRNNRDSTFKDVARNRHRNNEDGRAQAGMGIAVAITTETVSSTF